MPQREHCQKIRPKVEDSKWYLESAIKNDSRK